MSYSGALLRLLALAVEVQATRRRREPEFTGAVRPSKCHAVRLSEIPVLPPLPEVEEFRRHCAGLSPAQIYMTMLVMYAGRGDLGKLFDVLEWYQKLSDSSHRPEWAVSQMIDKDPLPQYLAAGVRRLDAMGVDLDGLC